MLSQLHWRYLELKSRIFNRACLVNTKLYLPKKWTDDKNRCDEAHIPKDKQQFKTKDELALDLVDEAIALDMQFGHV